MKIKIERRVMNVTRKVRVDINLPADITERSKAMAEERGASLSVVIERLLRNWLSRGGEMPPKEEPAKNKSKK